MKQLEDAIGKTIERVHWLKHENKIIISKYVAFSTSERVMIAKLQE